jgi:drug/metabolite transporter (DMT)-like permease
MVPDHGAGFWINAAIGGFAQILGTTLLIMAFGFRNYVVGTAYAKTEAVQGAILAMIMLGEHVSLLTWVGIGVGVAGVLVLSAGGQRLRFAQLAPSAALCGLGAGSSSPRPQSSSSVRPCRSKRRTRCWPFWAASRRAFQSNAAFNVSTAAA